MTKAKHSTKLELQEIRNQLSYSKRIGFLFGAGTSKSMGVPDIAELTRSVHLELGEKGKVFDEIKTSLPENWQHVEGILSQLRLIRQLTGDSEKRSYESLTGKGAKLLDLAICNSIYNIISAKEDASDSTSARNFIGWLNWLSRDYTKEIFTTNYDLILEKSFEHLFVPFYDGFIGSHEPFFAHESLDGKSTYDRPPNSWIRLWKLHGSLGWFWKQDNESQVSRVIRLGAGAKEKYPESEIVIYPSREKYESSRKQPFIGYFDRLKDFLLKGEGIFIICGYSFSDEHINEIIYGGLNQNNRLHVIGFFYTDDPIDKIFKESRNLPNFTMIGPKTASISGVYGEWADPAEEKEANWTDEFWNGSDITLGDFHQLVRFLSVSSGKKEP